MGLYGELAPLYHLSYPDWDASIRVQREQLSQLIETEWPGHRTVLDVSRGIGTQRFVLAGKGYP